ncbi:MAG: acyltransferase family protein [Pikeienuella sp.]
MTRRYDLDWLRVLLFGLLVPYHAAIGFVGYGHNVYGYRNQEAAGYWLDMALFFSHSWRLSALFMISGIGTWFLLRRVGAGAFAWNRVVRLGLPLVVAMLVWNAPIGWFHSIVRGEAVDFWGVYGDWLSRSPRSMAQHLWFLINLLAYSLLCLPLFLWLRGGRMSPMVFGLVLVGVLSVVELALKPFGFWGDPLGYQHVWYLVFYAAGYWVMTLEASFWGRLAAVRWWLLGVGIVAAWLFFPFYEALSPRTPAAERLLSEGGWLDAGWAFHTPLTAAYSVLHCLNAVIWCGIVFAFAYYHFDRPSGVLSRLNRAVYPVFIFHFPVMMGGLLLCRYVDYPWYIEWFALTVFTFALSGLLYWVLDRGRIAPVLMGLKVRHTH